MLNINFETLEGTKTLSDFPAKAYLIVNVASKCGLTPHYNGLQEIYEKFKDAGLEILGFPANDFLGQEPGSDEEIQNFCSTEFNVSFPINKKISVVGDEMHPLYRELLNQKREPIKDEGSNFEERLRSNGLIKGENSDQIHWNFEKFLVDGEGKLVARFFPDIEATSSIITEKLNQVLGL